MTRLSIVLIAIAVCGCARSWRPNAQRSAYGHSSMSIEGRGSLANDPSAPRPAVLLVMVLDVYHLSVPRGAVSGNDEFWKHVDEDRIDVGTHDLLMRNGVRIGLGRNADWGWFKGLLGKYPGSESSRARSRVGKQGYLELTIRSNMAHQVIFGLDDQGNQWGRTFEDCDDLLGVSFVASSHQPGVAVVKVCPIVRGLRRFYHVSVLNNEDMQVELKHSERLFDLRLEADVPMNDFLIVAPSEQARLSMSLGHTFLVTEGKSEPVEHVLVIVPRVYRAQEVPGAAR